MSCHTTTTDITGTTRPLPATTTTTTTRPQPRMDATGTAGEEHGLETSVSRASLVFFFFHVFFYNYTNLVVAIRVHPPPINLDVQPPTTLRLPCHHPTTHDTTTPPAHQGRRMAQKGPKRRV